MKKEISDFEKKVRDIVVLVLEEKRNLTELANGANKLLGENVFYVETDVDGMLMKEKPDFVEDGSPAEWEYVERNTYSGYILVFNEANGCTVVDKDCDTAEKVVEFYKRVISASPVDLDENELNLICDFCNGILINSVLEMQISLKELMEEESNDALFQKWKVFREMLGAKLTNFDEADYEELVQRIDKFWNTQKV